MQAFIDAVSGANAVPISFEQIAGSTLATLRLQNSYQTGEPQAVALSEFVSSALHQIPDAAREGNHR